MGIFYLLIGLWLLSKLSGGKRKQKATRKEYKSQSPSIVVTTSQITPTVYKTSSYRSKSSYRDAATFCADGRRIFIQDVGFDAYLIYLGKFEGQAEYNRPKSFIDLEAPIASDGEDKEGASMSYWPSYGNITPACRRAYLSWLKSGRRDKGYAIGYVFLYFYGLEYRLFEEGKWEDADLIINEVKALREAYADNRSFNRYSRDFLDAAILGAHKENAGAFYDLLEEPRRELSVLLRVKIGQELASKGRLAADLALDWWIGSLDRSLPKSTGRVFSEFRNLFKTKFEQDYPQGILIKAPKTKLNYSYHSASQDVQFSVLLNVPDIVNLKAPLKDIGQIAEGCIDSLQGVSRVLAKTNGEHTLESYFMLPKDARSAVSCKPAQILNEWISDKKNNLTFVPVKVLAEKTGTKMEQDRVTKSNLRQMAEILSNFNLDITPHPDVAVNLPELDGEVCLFPSTKQNISDSYAGAARIMELSVAVTQADGVICDEEKASLIKLAENDTHGLSANERVKILAYVAWLIKYPPPWAKLRSQLKKIPNEKRATVAKFALVSTMADGYIAPEEIKLLEKLYEVLEMDVSRLYDDLHSIGGQPHDQPVVVRLSDKVDEFKIPSAPTSNKKGVHLNREIIASIKADTQDVSQILSAIFSEEDQQEEKKSEIHSVSTLSEAYNSLLNDLLKKQEWSRKEYEDLCRAHGCMPDGAIEAINEWSFDEFDDALVEDGDTVLVNTSLLQKEAA